MIVLNENLSSILGLVCAYLLGSIPTGWLIGKIFFGRDIRQSGSGNTGATNALRSFGSKVGFTVLFIDMLKGLAAIILARQILKLEANWISACGLLVILGHVFPVWLKFKGGKGVATAAGVFAALAPLPFLIAIICFITITVLTRYISVASILSAICFHFVTIFQQVILNTGNFGLLFLVTIVVLMILFKHSTNLERLILGTENKLCFRKNKGNS